MENILIVLGILILGSAMGGTQLDKLPGAILSLGALVLAMFNSHARENMMSLFFIVPILLVVVGVMSYLAEKRVATAGSNSSSRDQLLASSNFQVIFILIVTLYFVSTFFWPFWS
jgi:branched-subunit amino acid ABC-type transport system permease component